MAGDLAMLSAFRASCATTLRHLEFNCAGVVSGVPFQGGLRHNLGCKNQRNAARAPAAAKTEKEKGLARQKEIDAALIKIANQDVKRPKRSPEELADAAHRVKEYSRLRMQHLRQFQRDQKIRERFRYETHLIYSSAFR